MMANVDFIVLKINDIDISQLPQQEVLNMFLKDTEPMLIQIRRKCVNNLTDINAKMENLKISNDSSSVATTETPQLVRELLLALKLSPVGMSVAKATQTENLDYFMDEPIQTTHENSDRLIHQEHNLFEQCLAPEIDIEEITLRKSDSNERLGLTVCYSVGNVCNSAISGGENNVLCGLDDIEACTEVYISDIQPDSVAGRDGRLRQGDQILQINGKNIKTKHETETLIAENNNAVTLLVSRYLYADEDDFNDPSVADIEVEDDDDDDDEEDDDEDEFYDENNLTYENCFISNDYINVVNELDKVLLAQVEQQQCHSQKDVESSSAKVTIPSVVPTVTTSTATTLSLSTRTTNCDEKVGYLLKEVSCKAKSSPKETELGIKKDELISRKSANVIAPSVANVRTNAPKIMKSNDDYEIEHIYETIPEDPESEPFYCSPYESSVYVTAVGSCSSSTVTDVLQFQQKQRVAQWLGIKPHSGSVVNTTAPKQSVRSSSGSGRNFTQCDVGLASTFCRNKSGTVRSAITTVTNGSDSSGGGSGGAFGLPNNMGQLNNCVGMTQIDDQDNSSSAYNTGGSNNSVSPLTLILNTKTRTEGVTEDDHQTILHSSKTQTQKMHSPKDRKITSPKNGAFQFVKSVGGASKSLRDSGSDFQVHQQGQLQPLSPKTMYTNEANLHQTMMLQQRLFRQALTLQKPHPQRQYQVQPEQMYCPQFTAPNLSQYHFVSSQEVSNVTSSNKISKSSTAVVVDSAGTGKKSQEEETMVWKVKRRPDGTRYIVRRPARNRLIRERNMRLNTERLRNDMTTTEDDTISEVKIGRYWTKEERKKHIERARERRQQQQQQQQLHCDVGAAATNCNGEIVLPKSTQQQHRDRTSQYHQQQLQMALRSQKLNCSFKSQPSQQYYQLQFNSIDSNNPKPTQAHNTNTSSDLLTKVILPPKSIPPNYQHIASPNDALSLSHPLSTLSPPNATLPSASSSGTVKVDLTNNETVVTGLSTHYSTNVQETSDPNKIGTLLSVTTV